MIIDISDDEARLIGYHLACRLDDYERVAKKSPEARKQWQALEELIYTKVIPNSWCGPKPEYWKGK